jgi:holin-like protein
MPLIRGFFVLCLFLIVGESLRFGFGWPVSGGVLGMLLLTLWLLASRQVSADIASASQHLIAILIILILPGLVGVFFLAERFAGQWLTFGVALVLGTLFSVASTFLIMMALTRRAPGQSEND